MVSMKLPKKDKDADGDSPVMLNSSPAERDAYPYGLRVDFDEPQVEALDDAKMLDDLDEEKEVIITARAYCRAYHKDRKQDGSWDRRLGFQITDVIDIKPDDSKAKDSEEKERVGSLLSPTR